MESDPRYNMLRNISEEVKGKDLEEGKSVEELLNGLGVVEEHHEHHRFEESGNAVLRQNDYLS